MLKLNTVLQMENNVEEIKRVLDNMKTELGKFPNQSMMKQNVYANNSWYLEIGFIEAKLDQIFLNWDWVIDSTEFVINAYMVRGTLTVTTLANTKIVRSGIGASEIQLRKGSTGVGVSDIASKALERDVPKAESQALKNAASKLGNIFGRNMNRDFKYGHVADDKLIDKIYNTERLLEEGDKEE